MKSNSPPILYKSLYTTLLSRAFLVTIAFLCSFNVAYSEKKERPFIIKGRVVESIAHTPLVGVKVMLLDSTFNVIDSTHSAKEAYVTLLRTSAAAGKNSRRNSRLKCRVKQASITFHWSLTNIIR